MLFALCEVTLLVDLTVYLLCIIMSMSDVQSLVSQIYLPYATLLHYCIHTHTHTHIYIYIYIYTSM